MRVIEQQMLCCLAAYRTGQNAVVEAELSDWQALYELAAVHKLDSVVCETLWQDPAFCGGDKQLAAQWQKRTLLQAALQAGRTQDLLRLGRMLEENKISYAVVKGIVCRAMYAQPDLRPSGDEDILIAPKDLQRCGEILQQAGFEQTAQVTESEPVAHWVDVRTGLHLELHTQLFSSEQSVDRLMNDCFSEQLQYTVPFAAEGGQVRTFAPTWHLLFLICHARKHFIYGGFGIRTLCDVITYCERYRDEIDRETVCSWLEKIGSRKFFDQMLAIAQDHLKFDLDASGWKLSGPVDPGEMLEDILEAGVYGQSTMSRRHSNNLVLHATEDGGSSMGLLQTVFPPRQKLVRRYPVLERVPVLLPVMWLHRLGSYGVELMRSSGKGNSPAESMILGKKRIEMMIKYGIIRKDK